MAKPKRTFIVWVPHNFSERLRAYEVCPVGTRKRHMNDPADFPAVRATLTLDPPKPRKEKRQHRRWKSAAPPVPRGRSPLSTAYRNRKSAS